MTIDRKVHLSVEDRVPFTSIVLSHSHPDTPLMQMSFLDNLFAGAAVPAAPGRLPAVASAGPRSMPGTTPVGHPDTALPEDSGHNPALHTENALRSSIAIAQSTVRLPTRYEHTDAGSCMWVAPVAELNAAVRHAATMMRMQGGIRLIPVCGARGSGKRSAAAQLTWNVPEATVVRLPHWVTDDRRHIGAYVRETCVQAAEVPGQKLLVIVVDDYDEWLARHSDDPHLFEDAVGRIDYEAPLPMPTLFLLLTTDRELHARLASSTTRMCRIAGVGGFTVEGPPREMWPRLIASSFRHHNAERSLVELGFTPDRIAQHVEGCATIGSAMAAIRDQVSRGAVDTDALTGPT